MLKEKRPHHGLSRQKSAPVLRFFAFLRRSFVQLPIWLRAVLNIGCFNARQPFAVHFVRPGPAEAASEQSAPAGLFGEVQRYATGELQFTDMHLRYLGMNETLSRMAADLVRRYKPNILTIHLPCTDEVQHREWREGGRCAWGSSGSRSWYRHHSGGHPDCRYWACSKKAKDGTHGYYPDFREIQTSFVAFGAGLAKDLKVTVMDLTDIAPLVAKLLGITMPAAEVSPHLSWPELYL